MKSTDSATPVHSLEKFLAVLAAVACLIITITIWRSIDTYQSMWPLPGLYFIEMVALSIAGAAASMRSGPIGSLITWAGAGILFAFSILGALSVGFFYLPIALIFSGISVSSDLRCKQRIGLHLVLGVLASIAQAALMFAMIRWPSPG